jgi:multicomponent Na+:H+ antiporter subunit E
VLLANLLLALTWAALQGEFSLRHLVTGHVLGYLVLRFLVKGGALGPSRYIGHVSKVASLALFFLWELVLANIRVAFDVATPRYHGRPGIIAVPLDATREVEILLLAMLINLTPGSVALDVSPDRRTLYVHVMYMTTPDAARAGIKRGFERRALEIFR